MFKGEDFYDDESIDNRYAYDHLDGYCDICWHTNLTDSDVCEVCNSTPITAPQGRESDFKVNMVILCDIAARVLWWVSDGLEWFRARIGRLAYRLSSEKLRNDGIPF